MTKSAHTQGPWEATDLTGQPVNHPAVMAEKHCVATVWIKDISRKQACANARLLAAAPIPQDLYDSEINFEIEPFWDGGFYVRLGDHMNGYMAEGDCRSYVEALEQLRDWAITHCPNSEFTKRYAVKVPA